MHWVIFVGTNDITGEMPTEIADITGLEYVRLGKLDNKLCEEFVCMQHLMIYY